jgi:hypothetical protein
MLECNQCHYLGKRLACLASATSQFENIGPSSHFFPLHTSCSQPGQRLVVRACQSMLCISVAPRATGKQIAQQQMASAPAQRIQNHIVHQQQQRQQAMNARRAGMPFTLTFSFFLLPIISSLFFPPLQFFEF